MRSLQPILKYDKVDSDKAAGSGNEISGASNGANNAKNSTDLPWLSDPLFSQNDGNNSPLNTSPIIDTTVNKTFFIFRYNWLIVFPYKQ